jgi:hypothetical protein
MPSGINPETSRNHRFKDRVGQRNGRLTFIAFLGVDKHKHNVWKAICDCGKETKTATPHKTQSCGCYCRERASEVNKVLRKLPPEEKQRRVKENAKRQRLKRKTDPLKAMQYRLSRLHRHALYQVNAIKTSPTFEELGYSVEQFVKHIEKQFLPGMSWQNMKDWQIDHIIPVSTAKNRDDVIALNQLPNLRPMWSADNNRKKNKIETLL